MSVHVGLVIELVVAALLAVSIVYCALLERRLRAIHASDADLRRTIEELDAATERAERAVADLRTAATDCERTLGDRLDGARRRSAELSERIRAGGEVIACISRIVAARAVEREAA